MSARAAAHRGIESALEFIERWDLETMYAVSEHPWLRRLRTFFVTATILGDGYLWGALALGMILFGTPAHRGHVLVALSITIVNIALFQLFKVTFSRPRPTMVRSDLWTRVTDEHSFPSGHTTIAFGIAWAVALLYPRLCYQIPAMFGAVTIALSRVYLREHYPLDVIGGALLGSVVALYLLPSMSTLLL